MYIFFKVAMTVPKIYVNAGERGLNKFVNDGP